MQEIFGGIEAGGTKFICAVGTTTGKIKHRLEIPTTTPEETMSKVIDFFNKMNKETALLAMGVASFGPVDLDRNSPTYGYITSTPKLAWTNYNILGAVKDAFDIPTEFETDVNGAAMGEYRWGAAQGLETFIYMTIGTGIGAGGMVHGNMIHGLMHPEMGHMFIPHDKTKDPFEGVCPFHGDCFEGLATGPSMMKRWNVKSALDLPEDHVAWDLESDYLAAALANLIMVLSPQKIIVGGGVTKQKSLLPKTHPKIIRLLNGYIQQKMILENIADYIVLPGLGENSGICGAVALAEKAYRDSLMGE